MNSSLRALILSIGAVFIVAPLRLLALDAFTGTEIDATNALPIEVSSVFESPASITFKLWRPGQYDIFRKAPSASTWSATPYATTAAGATSWTDSSVVVGNGDATGLNFMNHMGDVGLRLFHFPPPAALAVNPTGSGAELS